ncbi:MAG: hypothetical protein GX096_01535 [Clostridiales bacterium]|nr:hypothetical protein [Clostridiales bacterium]
MIKKLLAIVLVLCMFLPLCAVAEDYVFTLRNGYHWNMTLDEIKQLAQEEGLTPVFESVHALGFDNVPVAGYMVYMGVMTSSEKELRFYYDFKLLDPVRDSDANKQMYNDLLEKMTTLYGVPVDDGTGNDRGAVEWILPPDTKINLNITLSPTSENYFDIVYYYEPQPTETPEPTPQPTPEQTLVPVPNDGL